MFGISSTIKKGDNVRIIVLMLLSLFLQASVRSVAQCPYLTTQAKLKNPPQSRGASLLLGDFPEAQINMAHLMDSLLKNFNSSAVELDIPGSRFFNRYFAILSPTLAQQILLDTSGTFTKGSIERRTENNIFPPEGIIWMPSNERWKLLNTALFNGPFNPQCFPNCYAPLFQEAFTWFIQRLASIPQPFDLYRQCTYYSMRTMAHAFFNYILEDDELIAITDALKYMFTFMHKRETTLCNIPLAAPLPHHRLFYQHRATFNSILKKIIKNAPYSITYNGITYPTIMGVLVAHRDPETHARLTEDEITSHVATLFFAGHDTTANFITMLIYHLSVMPCWYNIIKDELVAHTHNRPLGWLSLNSLKEYSCFKNEVLRLFPSVPLVSIDTTQNVVLDGYTIPKNSTLIIALHTLQKHPDFFNNPEIFNPHRFNHDNPDYTPCTASSLMPFNFGQRRCLGQWFAQAEAQHLITHIIDNAITFTIEPLEKPLALAVELSGMPNQKIFAHINIPQSYIQQSHELQKNRAQTQDVPMRIIAMRYENEHKTIKTFRLAPLYGNKLPFSYNAGDHLEIIAQNDKGEIIVRHYSISSSPTDSDEWLEITIKKEETPSKRTISDFMHEDLIEEDILFVRAPLDDGVRVSHHDDPQFPLILISGGIGITPMMSIIRYCVAHAWQGETYLIHTCKTVQECAFYDELITLNKEYPNLHIIITCTQQADTSPNLFKGRINKKLFDQLAIADIQKAKIYLCGKESMCSELTALLKKEYAVQEKSIYTLSFGTIDTETILHKKYTIHEVAQHATRTDAWIIIEDIVYDVTEYIHEHPGFDIILDYLGSDATDAFNRTAHSATAKKILHQSDTIKIMGSLI